ncbi:MAG: PadR family transcriptional regulator [Halobaculum sp.]
MPESTLIPLTVLYTDGRSRVEGATRFQKLVFLTQAETRVPEQYPYHADKYGPFSPHLQEDLQELAADGLLGRTSETNAVGNERYVYSITPDGIRTVRRTVEATDGLEQLLDSVQQIKREYNDEPLQHLLKYVYRNYESYTTASELDLDRLFDPDTESQFLDPEDPADQFSGPPPGEWKERNSSAEDIFSV